MTNPETLQFGAATHLATDDFTLPPESPFLRDLDRDGDLDMITCPASVLCWWENTSSTPGSVPVFVQRGTLVDADGDKVYTYGNAARAFCMFDHPKEEFP